jgi:hypothetical protein
MTIREAIDSKALEIANRAEYRGYYEPEEVIWLHLVNRIVRVWKEAA